MCDASEFAVGAVLGQRIDGKFKLIYYVSKTLNNTQEHYTTSEKELLAVVFYFDKFHPYLILSKTVCLNESSALKGQRTLVQDHLSRLENPDLGIFTKEKIADKFPGEHLMILKTKLNEDKPCGIVHSWANWGYHSASITGRKVYESGFFWPSIFKDAKDYVMRCDACQRSRNISSISDMPQNNIQACDVESQALPTNNARIVIKFLRRLFERFRVPKALIIIMEYLVKISKKARILELKRRHLKITVLTSNTPYPSRKIRRICACTSPKTTKDQGSIRRIQRSLYAVFKLCLVGRAGDPWDQRVRSQLIGKDLVSGLRVYELPLSSLRKKYRLSIKNDMSPQDK
ncbi:reverse transcriptase domain-containing protein [Tanacetum coccineum]